MRLNGQVMVLCVAFAVALFGAPALGAAEQPVANCAPIGTCAHPLPVRVVIVTMFEIGADTGDAPGEFQFWRERRHLDVRIPFPQSYHDLFYNPDSQILGMVTGMGSIKSATATLALGLDPRFDLSHAYWLVAGIAGIDPHKASIGSAAWARYLVDGDLGHEIDPREIPKDWKTGYFPIGKRGPNDHSAPNPQGEMFEINPRLRDWAYALTKDMTLPDNPEIRAERARYSGYPLAQRPPFVLKGDQLAAMTFWHGRMMNDWAHNWVDYWTSGKGEFVTSAMEETGTYQSILYLDKIGRVDKNRFMVLRAGSNYTMPPPGVTAAQSLLNEKKGYTGMTAALESLYLVGSKVIDELEAHWIITKPLYRNDHDRAGERSASRSRLGMTLTVIKNADVLVTMDDNRSEIAGGAIVFRDGVIKAIGTTADLAKVLDEADEVLDARGCVVMPGLVNTHHHLFQSITRALPNAVNASLFDWLKCLYPIWARYTPDDVFAATQLGLAELALSGCTLSADHLYLFPNGVTLDDSIFAASGIGVRFQPTRGAMSVGESLGGLPPDSLVENEPAILRDTIRVIDRFHNAKPGAMVRVGVAPCSPFSVSQGLMKDAAELARDKRVMLHTHLAEDEDDVAFSLERFGCRPGQYAENLGWTGSDVWHAHCVQLNEEEIDLFARTKTGVAHCPSSNCRLGSGIAPLKAMFDKGVRVGLGVDGSASNDSGNLLHEARQAMLLQRAVRGPAGFDCRDALFLATRGGAEILGRYDCGSLQIGKRADIAIWDMTDIDSFGAWDLVAALILSPPRGARDVFVEGRAIVRDGDLVQTSRRQVLQSANRSLTRLKGFM